MATAERAFGNEVAHGFPKERAGDVEVANGFSTTKVTAGAIVEVANAFTSKNSAVGSVEIAAENGFTTGNKEEVGDVEVANANGFTNGRTGDDAEVLHDFSPLLVVYKSGRLERPLIVPVVPAGHDAATGVVSKDVPLSPFSFVRLYLPPGLAAAGGSGDEEKEEENATTNPAKKLPVVVYFHGGGFVMGSAASCVYHRFVNDLAAASPAVAVSVDYRLAPEHLLPAAYEDALAALRWVLSASDPWLAAHADPRRVFLAGDSAGGNICHHLAMHPDVRAAGGVRGVVLIHPWFWGTQPIAGELEHRRNGSSRRERKLSLWELVCPDALDGVDDPRMNPTAAGAPGLENLACEKVMVCVAEGDHLRWRGKAYAEAAARAGKMALETVESEGVGHVFFLLDPDMEEARELLCRIAGFVSDDDANDDKQGPSERGAAAAATARASSTIDHQ